MAKKELNLDEKFLEWWEKGLEKEGYDLDKEQVQALAGETDMVLKVYTYREFFQAMREGEYGPLLGYRAAYNKYRFSLLN